MKPKNTKFLLNVDTAIVVCWNEALAKRAYMVECDIEGNTITKGGRRLVIQQAPVIEDAPEAEVADVVIGSDGQPVDPLDEPAPVKKKVTKKKTPKKKG